MIPKIIHYVWVGGKEIPETYKNYITSWKKFNPDYEIKEWNENNFDISMNLFTQQAYEAKKYGFVPDFIRLWVLYNYGGIYLDTDVECFKSFDDLLGNKCVLGFETHFHFGSGIIMSEKGHPLIKYFMDQYANRKFITGQDKEGNYILNLMSEPTLLTIAFMKYKKRHFMTNSDIDFGDVILFERKKLCPSKNEIDEAIANNVCYTVHHFAGSWKTDKIELTKFQYFITRLRFAKVFKLSKLWGNASLLRQEQRTYDKAHVYTKKNRKKGKKTIETWL